MSEIRIKPDEIAVNERGEVIIANAALADALANSSDKAPEAPGFLDWKCTNQKCGVKQ